MGRSQARRVRTPNKTLEKPEMNCLRTIRLAMIALVPAAAMSLGLGHALAQSPPAAPPAASAPSTPAPATTPAPPPAANPTTTPSATPAAPPVQTADPFGEEIMLAPKTVVILKGSASWDSAFDTLIDSFKTLTALLDKQNIKPAGNP